MVSNGWSGGPGVNTFYFVGETEDQTAALIALARVHTLFESLIGIYPRGVSHTLTPEVDQVDSFTGNVTDVFPGEVSTVIQSTVSATEMAPTAIAALGTFKTNTFTAGKRMKGRAFFSPLGSGSLDALGTLNDGTRTGIANALTAMIDSGSTTVDWVVWQRPRKANSGTAGNLPARAGKTAVVVSASCNDKLAVLRSRRD
jgi:hypothetical protein